MRSRKGVLMGDVTRILEKLSKIGDPKDIELDDFLALYPPRRNCKHCFGRGYRIQILDNVFVSTRKAAPQIGKITDKTKRKLCFCSCVNKQYLLSGEHYRVYLENSATGERDFLLQ